MQHIEGYVFKAQLARSEPLFGSPLNVDRAQRDYGNMESKAMLPYADEKTMKQGAWRFIQQKSERVSVVPVYITLDIADDVREASRVFAKKSDLIVVAWNSDCNEHWFIGPWVRGKPDTWKSVPGARLKDNGWTPFTPSKERSAFERAHYAASEVARQGQMNVRFAHLDLRNLMS